ESIAASPVGTAHRTWCGIDALPRWVVPRLRRLTAYYSAAITACDFAQPTGDRGGIPGYR
ncbi:MAG: hypothetical protein WBX00_19000, partial [Isosphaeraceae bacterium]